MLDRKGIHLSVTGLSYSDGSKQILRNVSGQFSPGRALAILGPSGAGKTTFLDILAGKAKRGNIDGELLVNGARLSKSQYRRLVGFVDQEDVLMDTLTVRETLMFSAKMRLPESMSLQAKKRRVGEVIDQLGLSHVADSRVGGRTRRGISGGEKRRVSIGAELVTSPAILFLDEPTSGLDSYNAHAVVKTICDLAHKSGKTIVFTIHQPRSDVYAMFDDVAVLQKGRIMYFGHAEGMERFFSDRGHPCPPYYNIADWVLDVAAGKTDWDSGSRDGSPRSGQSVDSIAGEYELRTRRNRHAPSSTNSTPDASASFLLDTDVPVVNTADGKVSIGASIESIAIGSPASRLATGWEERDAGHSESAFRITFLTKMATLLERGALNFWRRPVLWATHLGIAVGLGAFVGGLYWHSDSSLAGIQNRFGSIFFLMALLGFSALSAIGALSEEREIFIRERANGFYGPIPFLLSRIVFDLIPLRIIPALIMGIISFHMVGYTDSGDHFARFISVLCLFAANAGLLCMAVGTLIRDIGTANLVGSLILLFHMLFAGFLLNQDQIPLPLRWIQYLSLFRFAYEALVTNDINGLTITDEVSGLAVNVPASIVLDKFGFDRDAFARDLGIEVAWFVGFLGLILALTAWKLKERR